MEKIKCPYFVHALTGCNTVSSFAYKDKKTAWSVWNTFPQLTDALVSLSDSPSLIPNKSFETIKRFVVLLFDRTSEHFEVNEARQTLFPRRKGLENIPPTKEALHQHVRKATFQGGYVWGQCLETQQSLPSLTEWGWQEDNNG